MLSVACQDYPSEIIAISRPMSTYDKRASEGTSRYHLANLALELAAKGTKFFVMMDKDVVLPSPHTISMFERHVSTILDHKLFVHLKCKPRYVPMGHMDIECFSWPATLCSKVIEAFSACRYRPNVCWCEALSIVAHESGIKQEWMS
jgi:hypothetical protein